jgi:hydroxymethylglutaryl-CoA lyase
MQEGKRTRIYVNEVATRDGFQMESRFIPTADKIALIDRLGLLGYAKIEVTSFASPKAIPALADGEAVMRGVQRAPGVVYTALVPNRRGAERAPDCRIDEFNVVMSVSETHNLANLRMTREQSVQQLCEVIELAQAAHAPVNVSLSCCFGCPIEGEVAPIAVMELIERFAARGAQGITLCDTTGMAYPTQVQSLCGAALARHPGLEFTAHFHNTRAMGLVNIIAAIEAGIRRFDMSLGGIGGCPYAPGATGNVATEDVVHMLECMDYDTGIDLDGLIAAARVLETLVRHSLPGQLSHAGVRLHRHHPPADFEQIVARAHARDS